MMQNTRKKVGDVDMVDEESCSDSSVGTIETPLPKTKSISKNYNARHIRNTRLKVSFFLSNSNNYIVI